MSGTNEYDSGRWSNWLNQGAAGFVLLLQLSGVIGLFALVAGLAMLLAASVSWIGRGHDAGFSQVGWLFFSSGLLLSGLGFLGIYLGRRHDAAIEQKISANGYPSFTGTSFPYPLQTLARKTQGKDPPQAA